MVHAWATLRLCKIKFVVCFEFIKNIFFKYFVELIHDFDMNSVKSMYHKLHHFKTKVKFEFHKFRIVNKNHQLIPFLSLHITIS